MGRTSKASQEANSPIIKSGQSVRRSRQLEIRDVGQLVVPPRRVKRSVGSQALVERKVQILQRRSDDPRSTSGTGSDLELSRLEVLGDGGGNGGLRSLSWVDEVGGRGGEAERVRSSGSCKDDESEKSTRKVEGAGVCSTGEVIHFVVQDDPIGSHDP
jgi:hypothetical protein